MYSSHCSLCSRSLASLLATCLSCEPDVFLKEDWLVKLDELSVAWTKISSLCSYCYIWFLWISILWLTKHDREVLSA